MSQELNILFVCTGNICRSAAADALASMYFRHAPIHVSSAGIRGLINHPIQPTVGTILLNAGIDASSFRSQRLTNSIAMKQDVILCFEKRQRSSIVSLAPSMVKHTYLLTDFANMCRYADINGMIPNSDIAGRIRYIDSISQMLRAHVPEGADIDDPYGKQEEDYQRAVYETAMALKMIIVPSRPAAGVSSAAPGAYNASEVDDRQPAHMAAQPVVKARHAAAQPTVEARHAMAQPAVVQPADSGLSRDSFPVAAATPRHAGRVIRGSAQ